ncbi:MAG TPA: hypothetical protein VEA36_03215 [Candidatus Paceibacterota bacterium]|nr:hypothetical protein [Candidatus Paceibacterota bacterium]
MNNLSRKTLALTLALLIMLPTMAGAFPRSAHAQLIVHSPLEYEALMQLRLKEAGLLGGAFSLDGIAWVLAKTAISTMTKSLVNWINSGFQGSPAFATDLRQNLLRLGDAYAARFFDEITNEVIESPYRDEIATALRTHYYLSTGGAFYIRNPYTLNQYSTNPVDFLNGNFSQGGLSAWFSTVMNAQNNPYTALQLAQQELDSRLASAGGRRITELNWGQGFMSWRGDCARTAAGDSAAFANSYAGGLDTDLNELVAASNAQLADEEGCLEYGIKTPGTVIESAFNNAVPKGMEGLITADEIDEVVAALFQQLITQVVGKTGLLGISAPSSGGGRSFIDQATLPDLQGRPPTIQIDPAVEAKLAAFESGWRLIGEAATAASKNCPQSAAAQNALKSAVEAKTRVEGVRKALKAGATLEQVGTLMPSDEEVAAAQTSSAEGDGSLRQQLTVIAGLRSCPSS